MDDEPIWTVGSSGTPVVNDESIGDSWIHRLTQDWMAFYKQKSTYKIGFVLCGLIGYHYWNMFLNTRHFLYSIPISLHHVYM